MSPRIIVADDSLTVRMDLEEAFREAGYETRLCASLEELRAVVRCESCDLIVLDLVFPDGNGTDLLEELRASPPTVALPVIVLSSESEVQSRVRGLHAGAQDFAGKPYDRDFVVARAAELLGERAEPESEGSSARVLVIDDSITFRSEFRRACEEAGYRVLEATTGEEGLREAARSRPHAIVVDGLLPDIDGATVVRRLRSDAALRGTPCLLLTASADRGRELDALEAGPDAYMLKDQGMRVLLARVAALLGAAAGAASPAQPASLFAAKRILAIDDSETFLQTLAEELRGDGYDVVLARSGEEGLDLLEVQTVDCIVVDLVMPGLSGQETCRRIKASPKWRDIPVLVLTSHDDRETMIDGIRAGADDYIAKSSDFDVVRARIQAQLRRKRFEVENRLIREALHRRELDAAHDIQHMLEERARDLELANRYKSEFLANMSHELRTPLNSMLLMSRLLAENRGENLTEEQVLWAQTIHSSGTTLLGIIEDILDLAKLESRQLEVFPEDVDVGALAEGLERSFGCVAREKGVAFVIDVEAGAPAALVTDGQRLGQILNNLIGNALKFTEEGQVRVSIAPDRSSAGAEGTGSEQRPGVTIAVSDTGIGIAEDKQRTVFESFRQEDGTTSRRYGGTGLGLAITRQLTALLGGEIRLESRKGAGSTFTVTLPAVMSAPERGPPDSSSADPHAADEDAALAAIEPDPVLAGKRALIVDSDVGRLFSLSRELERIGMEVRMARRIDEGLEEVRAGDKVDVVLLVGRTGDADVDLDIDALRKDPILAGARVMPIAGFAATPGGTRPNDDADPLSSVYPPIVSAVRKEFES